MTSLADTWTAFWNGDLALASALLTDDFRIHFGGTRPADLAGDAITGPAAMAAFVESFRAERPGLRFAVEAPPLATADGFAVRWSATRPGVAVGGLDLARTTAGRIAEVWSLTGGRPFPA